MKIITKEEAAEIPNTYGGASLLRRTLLAMKAGQILRVEKGDVKAKGEPFDTCYRLNYQFQSHFQCKRMVSGEGWLIERTK